jgi:hypothetical protein
MAVVFGYDSTLCEYLGCQSTDMNGYISKISHPDWRHIPSAAMAVVVNYVIRAHAKRAN